MVESIEERLQDLESLVVRQAEQIAELERQVTKLAHMETLRLARAARQQEAEHDAPDAGAEEAA
jgi:hypothetical protein